METKLRNQKRHTHNVIMITDNNCELELEVEIDGDDIYFLRDINGVHAWHCNSAKTTDYNVKKIICLIK
jgi:hypothetical protein